MNADAEEIGHSDNHMRAMEETKTTKTSSDTHMNAMEETKMTSTTEEKDTGDCRTQLTHRRPRAWDTHTPIPVMQRSGTRKRMARSSQRPHQAAS